MRIGLAHHFLLIISVCNFYYAHSQTVNSRLASAYNQFMRDPQLQSAMASLYVIDANSGAVVFDRNSRIGLSPASTLKIITSITAFELLGADYQYQTSFSTPIAQPDLLYILPSGDPSFGSWRWKFTGIDSILDGLSKSLSIRPSYSFQSILIDNSGWESEAVPSGWIWEDIGNYYGAAPFKLNYRENQFDYILRSGNRVGDSVHVVKVIPENMHQIREQTVSHVVSAAKGTGDNAYVYIPFGNEKRFRIRGTIPVNEKEFSISASITDPGWTFIDHLVGRLEEAKHLNAADLDVVEIIDRPKYSTNELKILYAHSSPTLDTLVYWFNRRSINLYGEAFIRTFSYEKYGVALPDSGIAIMKRFWKDKGIAESELNIRDGSGLAPLNKVTTHAQVEILKFARKRKWYRSFYESLPSFNGMRMKSGTISGTKGFCGYHRSKSGKEYIFSFLVNNYNGSAGNLVTKMYKVLDVLK